MHNSDPELKPIFLAHIFLQFRLGVVLSSILKFMFEVVNILTKELYNIYAVLNDNIINKFY